MICTGAWTQSASVFATHGPPPTRFHSGVRRPRGLFPTRRAAVPPYAASAPATCRRRRDSCTGVDPSRRSREIRNGRCSGGSSPFASSGFLGSLSTARSRADDTPGISVVSVAVWRLHGYRLCSQEISVPRNRTRTRIPCQRRIRFRTRRARRRPTRFHSRRRPDSIERSFTTARTPRTRTTVWSAAPRHATAASAFCRMRRCGARNVIDVARVIAPAGLPQ